MTNISSILQFLAPASSSQSPLGYRKVYTPLGYSATSKGKYKPEYIKHIKKASERDMYWYYKVTKHREIVDALHSIYQHKFLGPAIDISSRFGPLLNAFDVDIECDDYDDTKCVTDVLSKKERELRSKSS